MFDLVAGVFFIGLGLLYRFGQDPQNPAQKHYPYWGWIFSLLGLQSLALSAVRASFLPHLYFGLAVLGLGLALLKAAIGLARTCWESTYQRVFAGVWACMALVWIFLGVITLRTPAPVCKDPLMCPAPASAPLDKPEP